MPSIHRQNAARSPELAALHVQIRTATRVDRAWSEVPGEPRRIRAPGRVRPPTADTRRSGSTARRCAGANGPSGGSSLAIGDGRPTEFLDDSHARLICEPSGWMDIDRAARSSTIHLPEKPAMEEIVQPRLGITAVVAAFWRGDHRFHAGAFVADGLAWGVLGSKGDGKSSLLAALASSGVPVLADDVLIVDRRLNALRRATLHRSEAMGRRRRWVSAARSGWSGPASAGALCFPRCPCEVPLGGFVCLEWGRAAVSQVSPEDRVRMLLASQALLIGEHRDSRVLTSMMELIALPMLRMRRPRAIDRIAATGETLLGGDQPTRPPRASDKPRRCPHRPIGPAGGHQCCVP